ncbi:hypothetical protein D2917_07915 [Cupriavidus oxalaticus]|uniref:DUF6471 domain-containing protein n=1 Tax=Cupriavidus oxalaticus TaxID=96344 RepID=A0A5P3VCP8_9BURK|nr:hypothetical protein D2917_07915 [Cupriavidus oxalaticus]
MRDIGIEETPKAIELKIQRGSFKCALFLQLLSALRADLPVELKRILDNSTSWDDACRQLVLGILADQSISIEEFSKQLRQCGVHLTSTQVASQVSAGVFPFTLILQLDYLFPTPGFERFVDGSDLARAASDAVAAMP